MGPSPLPSISHRSHDAFVGWYQNVLEQLDRPDCLRLLATEGVGRFVFTARGLPAVRPVTYVLAGTDIIVRTRPGTNVSSYPAGTVVAFQVDNLDPATGTGWSITVTGSARLLSDDEVEAWHAKLPDTWVAEATELIVLPIELAEGTRIRQDGARGA